MKKLFFTLCIFLAMAVSVQAETVTISFTPPTLNEDGEPLTDLAGYTLYYQQTAGIDRATAQKKVLDKDATGSVVTVQSGHWCFGMDAFDEVPNTSDLSNEECATVLDTTAPATFIIEIVGN